MMLACCCAFKVVKSSVRYDVLIMMMSILVEGVYVKYVLEMW